MAYPRRSTCSRGHDQDRWRIVRNGRARGCALCRRLYNQSDRRAMKHGRRMLDLLHRGAELRPRSLGTWQDEVRRFLGGGEAQG